MRLSFFCCFCTFLQNDLDCCNCLTPSTCNAVVQRRIFSITEITSFSLYTLVCFLVFSVEANFLFMYMSWLELGCTMVQFHILGLCMCPCTDMLVTESDLDLLEAAFI